MNPLHVAALCVAVMAILGFAILVDQLALGLIVSVSLIAAFTIATDHMGDEP